MTNTYAVCLVFAAFFCCANVSFARQVPKECAKGPAFWCQNLKDASVCGAVEHCIGTVWEKEDVDISANDVSNRIVMVFKSLKDVRELINEDYLSARINTACRSIQNAAAKTMCKENTANMEKYLMHVLQSETSPETMCKITNMCNNMKLDNHIALSKKIETHPKHKDVLVGAKKCTWGPGYWCSNFSTSHECKATKHCADRVWSKMEVKTDTDDICHICLDMVKQARDQLESNETQMELKAVFEGSCNLIPIKIVAKECDRLADDFVVELVDTLTSQMNPQQVCSVAGLCNNIKIDQLLEAYNTQLEARKGCSECNHMVGFMRNQFDSTSYDDFLVGLLQVCGKLGSFSDSCSMLVFKYYENILEAVRKDLNANSVCHLSGQCSYKFHTHDDFTFPKEIAYKAGDDVPCEFCEKLVLHLRDILTANSTEEEFYRVLKGLCKQTGNFKSECLSLADQYYPMIYKFLTTEIQPKEACVLIGVCGKKVDTPIAPLLPRELEIKVITPSSKLIGTDEANSYKTDTIPAKQENVRILGSEAALPIERMFVQLPQSKAACTFCQYFLHYLQVELSSSNTEDEIKEAVEKACDRLPESVNGECKQFVTQYGSTVIALLVQEIDPSSVCPALGICPQTSEVRRVAINSDKSNCPLCLFAVEQLETMLKNNRTEASIRKALDNLCNHLSQKLKTECVDFIDSYSNQLVEMLIANLNAQEICVYLQLCKDEVADPLNLTTKQTPVDKFHKKPQLMGDRNNFRKPMLPKHMLEKSAGGDIETNEIPDNTVNGHVVKQSSARPVCVLCLFVLKEIDDQIKDKHNEDEIKKIVHGVCKRMPNPVRSDCEHFVDKYAQLIITMLVQGLDPSKICHELKLCPRNNGLDVVRAEEILDCAVCETVVVAVKKVLANDKVDRDIVHIVEKSCALLPAIYSARCHTLLEVYGDSVIHLIEEFGAKGVCQKIGLCYDNGGNYVSMHREHQHN